MIVKTRLLPLLALIAFFVAGTQASEHSLEEVVNAIPVQDCVIEPSEIVDVGSAIPGVVEAIHVYRSDLVKKGELMVELESSVEQASLELAKFRAGLDTAIELRQESARFGYLTQKRELELLRKSAISLHDADRSRTETRMARLQVRQEQDNKAISELEYRRAEMILQQRRIRSPVEGVVMERFKSVGEFVEDEPLIRVAQLNPLNVEVIVPVDYLGRIVPGMQAEVTTGLVGSGIYQATVERVDRVADAASGTYGVRLRLANPDYKIPAGLRCQLNFLPQSLDEPEKTSDHTSVAAAGDDANKFPLIAVEQPVKPLELCYSVGPVNDENTAQLLVEKLDQQTEKLILRTANGSINSSYLVLAAEQTRSQGTKQLLARFDKAGITDRYLFLSGENKGRFSLGLYRTLTSANRRQEMLAIQGFETELQVRRKDVKHYWLDVALAGKPNISDQLQNIVTSFAPTATFKPMACDLELARR